MFAKLLLSKRNVCAGADFRGYFRVYYLAPTSAASENTSSTVTETELAPEPGELLTVHFIDVGQ